MENFKSVLISIFVLGIVGLIVYWSFATLQTGTEHVAEQKMKQLQKDNDDLKKENQLLGDEVSKLQAIIQVSAPTPKQETSTKTDTTKPATSSPPTVYKYQDLVNALQELVKDNISMKLGSSGSRVGTVQKFLNIYNKTSNVVDNDYGATTKKLVMTFQKKVGIVADGEAGVGTFNKMIDWLKKQG